MFSYLNTSTSSMARFMCAKTLFRPTLMRSPISSHPSEKHYFVPPYWEAQFRPTLLISPISSHPIE